MHISKDRVIKIYMLDSNYKILVTKYDKNYNLLNELITVITMI